MNSVPNNFYLNSPKSFHFEMPLYSPLDISDNEINEVVDEYMRYGFKIDIYCISCKKDSIFSSENNIKAIEDHPFKNTHNIINKIKIMRFKCARDYEEYFTYFLKDEYQLIKIGQLPSIADLEIPGVIKYRKVLGDRYNELTKSIGLAAHGVGIGSFVYLRRIFESLIHDAFQKAKETRRLSEEDFKTMRMEDKINILKSELPNFLVENKSLYSILSKGIHELSDRECLSYFEPIKIGIEQILDEKLVENEKKEKALLAKKAIEKLQQKIKK